MDEGANILRDLGNVEDKCNHSRHCDGMPIDKDCVAADSDETLLLHAKNRLKTLSLNLVGSRLADVSPDPRASDSHVGEINSLIRSLVGGEENTKVVRDPTKIATERWLEVRPSFGPMRAPPLSYAVAMLAESDADIKRSAVAKLFILKEECQKSITVAILWAEHEMFTPMIVRELHHVLTSFLSTEHSLLAAKCTADVMGCIVS